MTLIFCYFRTKYKPRDLLWGPRLTTSPEQKKVEGEIPTSPCGSRPAAAARLYRHGRSLPLLAPAGRTLLLKRRSQSVSFSENGFVGKDKCGGWKFYFLFFGSFDTFLNSS